MTILARLLTLGIARESTPGTFVQPVRSLPVAGYKPEDLIAELRDESFRGNDALLQGIYGGPISAAIAYQLPHLYPDVLGDHLRAIIGPDTLTAGIATTLSASTAIGATSITTVASIPTGSTIQIDTGANAEYAVTGVPSGAGPYTIPLTSTGTGTTLAKAHNSAVAVVSQATHAFAQDQRANPVPTYSLSQSNKIDGRGYTGCVESDLSVKIDPKGAVTADATWMGFASAVQTLTNAGFSQAQPLLGWQWGLTIGGVASTRGISGEYALKRATEAIQASTGTQAPREFFADSLECDLKLKAIFENNTDLLQFLGYTAAPLVSTLTQPLAQGGAVVGLTNSGQKSVKFAPDYASKYLQVDIDASAAMNTTDNGVITVSLKNFVQTAY